MASATRAVSAERRNGSAAPGICIIVENSELGSIKIDIIFLKILIIAEHSFNEDDAHL